MTIPELHKLFLNSTGVCTDTRKITENCLFFALKGANFNGNTFAQKALSEGALASVIDEEEFKSENTILVDDVLNTLQELARFHREYLKIPVIGITGSNGKTTSKELINAVLSSQFEVRATIGNLNNHIGVPLTLLSLKEDDEIAIIEMGANHQKEIKLLSNLSLPNIGYITNFGKAHMEGFGGIEGIIKGKSELYDNLSEHNQTALVNAADPIQMQRTSHLKRISFGETQSDYNYESFIYGEDNLVGIKYEDTEIKSKLTGLYNVPNLGAALSLGLHFEIPIGRIKEALENYTPQNSRSQWITTSKNKVLLDAYNANPSSMAVAIKNFSEIKASHKWVILGDMFELGEAAEAEHQYIAKLAFSSGFERVILAGFHFSAAMESSNLAYSSTEDVQQFLVTETPENKTILIKGSRGMALEKLLPQL